MVFGMERECDLNVVYPFSILSIQTEGCFEREKMQGNAPKVNPNYCKTDGR